MLKGQEESSSRWCMQKAQQCPFPVCFKSLIKVIKVRTDVNEENSDCKGHVDNLWARAKRQLFHQN